MDSGIVGGDSYTLFELVFGKVSEPSSDLDEDDDIPYQWRGRQVLMSTG